MMEVYFSYCLKKSERASQPSGQIAAAKMCMRKEWIGQPAAGRLRYDECLRIFLCLPEIDEMEAGVSRAARHEHFDLALQGGLGTVEHDGHHHPHFADPSEKPPLG